MKKGLINKSIKKAILMVVVFLLFSIITEIALASTASSPDLQLQVPIFSYSKATDIAQYISRIYEFALFVLVPIAIVVVIYGGFRWVTSGGDMGRIGEAKKYISGAVLGLILAILSYIVLSMLGLTSLTAPGVQNIPSGGAPPSPASGPVSSPTSTGTYTHSAAEALLAAEGISITSTGNCSDWQYPTCTSLTDIPKKVIEKLIQIKQDTGCSFRVTGGTEVGHITHGRNKPVVDLSLESCLIVPLKDRSKYGITDLGADASVKDRVGARFVDPGHFHVVF